MIRNSKFMSFITKAIYDLPVPCNLSVWWNFGSLLGVCMVIQLLTGVFISMHYVAHPDMAFLSIDHLMRNVKNGWVFRYVHANGASMFFFALYVHVGRGLYYGSYKNVYVWNSGVLLFFLTMIVAFLGYVLPWGQMSYWGATVITNFFTVLPKIGVNVAMWLWGGYVVGGPTLTRFYTFHFLIPFVMLVLIVAHILFLHVTGSNNPLGIKVNSEKVPFHIYYTVKDLVGVFMFLFIFAVIVFFYPTAFMDPNNYLVSDSMDTPMHIKPEWYFLFAYTILRAIPNKTGGVVMLVLSVLILFTVPIFNKSKFVSMSFYPVSQVLFWCFFTTFVMLSWVGTKGTDYPFDFLSKLCTFNYFLYFFFVPICNFMWDWVLLGGMNLTVKNS